MRKATKILVITFIVVFVLLIITLLRMAIVIYVGGILGSILCFGLFAAFRAVRKYKPQAEHDNRSTMVTKK